MVSRPPIKKGGQDARPTISSWIFLFESNFVLKTTIAYRKLPGFNRTELGCD